MKIIPFPNSFHAIPETFLVNENTSINYSNGLAETAQELSLFIKSLTNKLPEQSSFANINLTLDPSFEDEQYLLIVRGTDIHLAARTNIGAFYGLQTLKQLVFKKGEKNYISGAIIEDRPRFPYRGLMLDAANCFFPKDEVFRLIDLISFHKLNILHLKLTDNINWRIENKLFFKDTKNTLPNSNDQKQYYSKKDIKEIINYAKTKHITIIPEIDIISSLIFLSTIDPMIAYIKENTKSFHFCLGNEKLYSLLSDILLELITLFEGDYFHLGGGSTLNLKQIDCSLCKEKIEAELLNNPFDLKVYFLNYFGKLISAHNKKPIIWNQNLTTKTMDSIIGHYYDNSYKKKRNKEINFNRKVILSDNSYFAFHKPYSMIPLSKVYNYEPIQKNGYSKEHILGVEATLYTMTIRSRFKLDFHIFPRLAAFSEVAWTESHHKEYDGFIDRLEHVYNHYKNMNVNFAPNKTITPNVLKRTCQKIAWLKDNDFELKRKK